jgi:ABC-type lipoprotein release transport system permease subunit
MSIVGAAVGVMVLSVVQSVMHGFQHEIRQTIGDTEGEVDVDTSNNIIYHLESLNTFLKSDLKLLPQHGMPTELLY